SWNSWFLSLASCCWLADLVARRFQNRDVVPVRSPRLRRTLRSAGNIARRRTLYHRGRVHQTVVAALDAGMILIAWDQQTGVLLCVAQIQASAGNVAAIVDEQRRGNVGARGNNQRVQVDEGSTVLPQESPQINTVVSESLASHLPLRIDADRFTLRVRS